MKVTFILPVATLSGGIKVIAIYAKALTEKGHNVLLVSYPSPPITFLRKAKLFFQGKGWASTNTYRSWISDLELDHRVLDSCRALTDADVPDADIIIATWWETAEWVNKLSNSKGVKVHFIQGHEVFCECAQENRVQEVYSLPLHKIVISHWLKTIMWNEYGDNNVDLILNSVDHQQFNAPVRGKQPSPTIGFLYHHSYTKGVDVILLSVTVLRKLYPNLRVVCFGTVAPSGQLMLENWIEFHLDPPQKSIKDLYAQCDVWVSASRNEGFNLTAMEAMACRTPVVSTNVGWPEESIESGKNGVLVDINDVNGLVEGVKWVLNLNEHEWGNLSDAAYEAVKSSSWAKSEDLFERALIRVLENASLMSEER